MFSSIILLLFSCLAMLASLELRQAVLSLPADGTPRHPGDVEDRNLSEVESPISEPHTLVDIPGRGSFGDDWRLLSSLRFSQLFIVDTIF